MARRNTPVTGIPLTGDALRAALWQAGLAPERAEQSTNPSGPRLLWQGREWEPWSDISAVWHLVLRYRLRIELDYCGQGTWVWYEQHYERAASDTDIVSAIARLALRLHQAERTQEGQYVTAP